MIRDGAWQQVPVAGRQSTPSNKDEAQDDRRHSAMLPGLTVVLPLRYHDGMKNVLATRPCNLASTLALLGMLAAFAAATQQVKDPKQIYPDPAVAKDEIKVALTKAAKEHKRVILDFGGNWCGDCKALARYFQQEPNATLLKRNFILIDVNIGRFDQNKDIAKAYDVPLDKGVPALAVIDAGGHTFYSQKNGEFESMRTMDPSRVTEFLKHWKS